MASAARRRQVLRHCSVLWLGATLGGLGPTLATATAATPMAGKVILVMGDSLSAEYGLARGRGWVALLQARVALDAPGWTVVNASISGDTTSGGRSRLPGLLKQHQPTVVVLELGGNDALRGLPLDMTRSNLANMAKASQAVGARVLVAGMAVPPNYGRDYGEKFTRLFAEVAKAEKAALVPFLLKGVADVPNADALFQADRIHPKAEAHPTMLANVWPVLKPMLR